MSTVLKLSLIVHIYRLFHIFLYGSQLSARIYYLLHLYYSIYQAVLLILLSIVGVLLFRTLLHAACAIALL